MRPSVVVAMVALLAPTIAPAEPSANDSWLDAETGEIVPASVRFVVAGTIVRAFVRVQLEVEGPATTNENLLNLGLPMHGVVTAATVRAPGHVESLRLAPVATVDETFSMLVNHPARGRERSWGVRLDMADSGLDIGVIAPRAARVTLDLTIEAPSCAADGKRLLLVPAAWRSRVARFAADDSSREQLDERCGTASVSETWVSLPARVKTATDGISATAGRLAVDDEAHFTRLELVTGTLGRVPADLHTAIVVDQSRSMKQEDRESQRAIVEAYLRAVPRSRVQVIAYARHAQPLLGAWSSAAPTAVQIDRALRDLAPRNGSNLDEGIAEAARWLARVQGTKRMIVFSDQLVPYRMEEDVASALGPLVPAGTLVHVVVPSAGDGTLVRNDSELLGPVALLTGGILVTGGPGDDTAVDATVLARPVSLDNVTITGVGWQMNPLEHRACTSDLGTSNLIEGRSCVWWADGPRAAGPLTITGSLWGRTVTRIVSPDPRHALQVARVLSALHGLDPTLQAKIDRLAVAVNAVWSLFATWGRSGGYDQQGRPWSTVGVSHTSCCSGGVRGTGTGVAWEALEGAVRRQLAPAVARCKASRKTTVTLEVTFEEITSVHADVTGAEVATVACVREEIWNTSLTLAAPPAHAPLRLAL